MTLPPGAQPSVYESVFILEKNGKPQEFTLENYPDSTWKFIDTRTVLKKKGYEPPIHDVFDYRTENRRGYYRASAHRYELYLSIGGSAYRRGR